eukprot:TRINITY_DN89575_c0_g1_i1.p1 TRINITY_DN89575_c0_g1~~TRINITY_DN89575_c0_g1_i1.p1  ORF type:complete len:444 (-),score=36.07 TRINITY_DN89575_c0_g1_i1:82-1413(-)
MASRGYGGHAPSASGESYGKGPTSGESQPASMCNDRPDNEADVLPLFYYNDLLVSQRGEQIGLNLFEPRYQEMCRRMTTDPRFIFMPNFEDYTARAGDVGFVIKLTQLRQQPSGAFGIQGIAESLVAVACTWVEPETNGLHIAHFWRLNDHQDKLTIMEVRTLVSSMTGCGWRVIRDSGARHKLVHAAVEGAEVVLGANWPNFCWLLGLAPSGHLEPLTRCLSQSWVATLPMLSAPRFTASNFATQVVQPGPPLSQGVCLSQVVGDIRAMIRGDPDAVCTLNQATATSLNLFARCDPDRISETLWNMFLSQVCISRICGMTALLLSVQVQLCLINAGSIHECFPWRERAMTSDALTSGLQGREIGTSTGAILSNAFNVYFFARLEDLEVTAESGSRALRWVCWMLNRLRLTIVQRGRVSGRGLLALLEDDLLCQITDFVAPRL